MKELNPIASIDPIPSFFNQTTILPRFVEQEQNDRIKSDLNTP